MKTIDCFYNWSNLVFLRTHPHMTVFVGHKDVFLTDSSGKKDISNVIILSLVFILAETAERNTNLMQTNTEYQIASIFCKQFHLHAGNGKSSQDGNLQFAESLQCSFYKLPHQ